MCELSSYMHISACVHTHTHTLLLGVRAPFLSCPLTGAILPVFTHLPPLPLPAVPSTVPCNPEAQCLAATLTTHWTATCCLQNPTPPPPSPPPPLNPTHSPIPNKSPPHPDAPPQLTNHCLASNHISSYSTRLRHYSSSLSDLPWNYLFAPYARSANHSIMCSLNEWQAQFT